MNKLYKEEDIQAIGNAIRTKGGTSALLKVEDMAQAIADIPEPTGTQTVTENGTYNISDKKYVAVNVPSEGITPTGTIEITENGIHDITEYAKAYVNVSGGQGGVIRDDIVIPDSYNTGCSGELTPLSEWVDDTNLTWYDSSKTIIDFNQGKAFKNIPSNSIITIENVDFSENATKFEFRNAGMYTPSSAYYRTGITLVFRNCRFCEIVQAYDFNVSLSDLTIKFENCTWYGNSSGNTIIDKCLYGGASWWRENYSLWTRAVSEGDVCNPRSNTTIKNSYWYDCEDNWGETSSGTDHIDGLQTYPERDNIHLYNCRFECYNMPFNSQGEWAYGIYWERANTNSSIEYCIVNGGGNYALAITKEQSQIISNNQVSRINQSSAYYPNPNYYQEIDGVFGYTDNLYVSSIYEDSEHINIIYSNDTPNAKTLTVKVNGNTTYTYNVSACPKYGSAGQSAITEWDDLPFDKIAVINKNGVNRIEVYDGDTLIRTYGSGGGYTPIVTPLTVTQNGTYSVPQGTDGYNPVTVNVPSSGIEYPSNMTVHKITLASDASEISVPITAVPSFYYIVDSDIATSGTNYTVLGIWNSHVLYWNHQGARAEAGSTVATVTVGETAITFNAVGNFKFRKDRTYYAYVIY